MEFTPMQINIKKLLLTFVLFTIFSQSDMAQSNKIDSLTNLLDNAIHDTVKVDILLSITEEYQYKDNAKAIKYAREALHVSRSVNFKSGIADACIKLSTLNILLGNLDSASAQCNKSLRLYRELNLPGGELECYNNLSVIEYYKGNTIESIKYAKKALIYANKTGNTLRLGKINNNIGLMYSNKGMYDSALVYGFRALKYFEELKDSININGSLINIGGYYLQIDDSINTIDYISKAIVSSQQLNDKRGLCICYSNLAEFFINHNQLDTAYQLLLLNIKNEKEQNDLYGIAVDMKSMAMIFKMQGKYDQAIEKLNECSQIQQKMHNKHGFQNTNYELADIYYRKKEYKKAEEYGKKSLELAEELQEKNNEQNALKLLSNIYMQTHDYKNACIYLNKSNDIKDSLFNIAKNKQMEELTFKYQAVKKEQANQKLSFENKMQKIEIDSQKQKNTFYVILVFLLFSLSLFIARQLKKKNTAYKDLIRKNSELLNKEKELIRLKATLSKNNIRPEKQRSYSDDKKEELLTKIEYEFEQNKIFKQDISLKKLATRLNTNTSYLSDIINSYHNKSFPEFINHYRIQDVIKMMESENHKKYSLGAIAEMAGFNSEKTFSCVFKKTTGLSPGFYRKNINNM